MLRLNCNQHVLLCCADVHKSKSNSDKPWSWEFSIANSNAGLPLNVALPPKFATLRLHMEPTNFKTVIIARDVANSFACCRSQAHAIGHVTLQSSRHSCPIPSLFTLSPSGFRGDNHGRMWFLENDGDVFHGTIVLLATVIARPRELINIREEVVAAARKEIYFW